MDKSVTLWGYPKIVTSIRPEKIPLMAIPVFSGTPPLSNLIPQFYGPLQDKRGHVSPTLPNFATCGGSESHKFRPFNSSIPWELIILLPSTSGTTLITSSF